MTNKPSKADKNHLPLGGVIPKGGTAHDYSTGGWRKLTPSVDKSKCTNCMICWVMCPDSAIIVEDAKMIGFDLEHCKGCGICAVECPDKISAIKMEEDKS
ncbi:MAG: 4Fe-4S binding protein [Deltaproteobacteria bacterium]|nr:4Fe-4S binding protein [Deltaproteobacteria bacterium]